MFLIFSVMLTLVVLVPLLWPERLAAHPQLRPKLYAALGIAAFGALVTGVGLAIESGVATTLLRLVGLAIGLLGSFVLAGALLESARDKPASSPSADRTQTSPPGESTPGQSEPTPQEDNPTP